jgi:hypothetical protein
MRRTAPFLLAALLVLGCRSTYQPPQPRDIAKDSLIEAPREQVWQTALRYFAERDIPIESSDHATYSIATKPVDLAATFAAPADAAKPAPLQTPWCDCGRARMLHVWATTQRVLVSFAVVLRGRSPSSTDAAIDVSFDGVKLGKRRPHVSRYDVEMPLQCVSTGRLERALVRYLRDAAASPARAR